VPDEEAGNELVRWCAFLFLFPSSYCTAAAAVGHVATALLSMLPMATLVLLLLLRLPVMDHACCCAAAAATSTLCAKSYVLFIMIIIIMRCRSALCCRHRGFRRQRARTRRYRALPRLSTHHGAQ
jgi:hypothetical protein